MKCHKGSAIVTLAYILCITVSLVVFVHAEDTLEMKDGSKHQGRITGSTATSVAITVKAGTGTVAMQFPMEKISKVNMTEPSELAGILALEGEARVSGLKEILEKYNGLPAAWVVDSMGKLADTYMAIGKDDLAEQIFTDIEKRFPGSKFLVKANVGKAKAALKRGELDKAMEFLMPLITEANATPAPTVDNGRLYGEVFLTKGKILEKKNDNEGAYESYLTVMTTFYQNQNIVREAEALAEALLKANPKLAVK